MRTGRQGFIPNAPFQVGTAFSERRAVYSGLQIFHSQKCQKMVGAMVIGSIPASLSL